MSDSIGMCRIEKIPWDEPSPEGIITGSSEVLHELGIIRESWYLNETDSVPVIKRGTPLKFSTKLLQSEYTHLRISEDDSMTHPI